MMSRSAPLLKRLRTTYLLLVYLSFLLNNASKSVLTYALLVEMEHNAAATKEGKLPPKNASKRNRIGTRAYTQTQTLNKHLHF